MAKRAALTLVILLIFFANILFASQVSAQPIISLSINKIIGYQLGSDINGQFTVSAKVSSDVVRVEFCLNDTLHSTDTDAPFSWTFDTNSYALGNYNITAVAYDQSGQQATAFLNQNFVDSTSGNIILIGVIIFSIVAVTLLVWLQSRNNNYVKCPKCGYVYRQKRYGYGIHLSTVISNRCPNCGKMFLGKKTKKSPDKTFSFRLSFSSK